MTRRLTGLDAAFLALETPTSTGHVGGLSILDPSTATEPLTLERLTAILASRLDAVPVLRQRLQSVPLGIDQPVWVDDRHFDIGYHVRELGLPSPGSDEQLAEQVSRIHARPLDRERPLWETYLLSGLAGGRMAVYTKVHHAAIDGVSGAEMLTLLFDLSPEAPTPGPAPEFRPQPGPGAARLGVQAIGRLAWRPVEVAKLAVNGVRAIPAVAPVVGPLVGNLLGLGRGPSGDGGVIKSSTPLVAPPTPLNVAISPHRRFAFASLPLDEVKFVKNTFEVSVNDVVMAISAGALRRWLLAHDALPDGPLVAMVPVSIRGADDGVGGNKVSAMLAALPTQLEDPVERLAVTRQATMIAKAQQAFIPQGLVDDVSDFAPPALTARAARVMFASKILHRLPAFNTVISNVPGPNVPIYLAGAKLLAHHPVSVVTDGIGLNITVIGYLGQLNFGLVAAREIVPDLADLMGWFGEELALLVAAAHAAAGNGSESEAHTEGNVSGRRSRGTAPTSGGRRPRSS
ncbi:MAG: wax ester/triacylglycerol synthase family O-acyltransferase [Phycicoccus sp.]|uniref:WS/DGAT/MGAT family O-acyltransferase n=1 Tax=Phycicoccus sp. TaxID=1902410 RepID=UPI00258C8F49|nr:wax ester/triacylglycerol synthase family O-acyltransferase [Phycicoccus sp.]MCO5303673.1 wax ester/triacylglycerol synthase family O-acyltransferase [Phycicoccus sp.]